MRALSVLASFMLAAGTAAPRICEAQARASEIASLSQTVNGAEIKIEYYRPVARGRPKLFGGVVKWNEVWTPGANWATTLDVSRDFKLNGHAVPKGKYSMWMIPAEQGEWTVFLDKNVRKFHTQRPKESERNDAVRFTVAPDKGPHMEALAFYFPSVSSSGATLRMHWGETIIPIEVTVAPPNLAQLTAEQRQQFIGEYKVTMERQDTTYAATIAVKGDTLTLFLAGEEEESKLLPIGTDRFWLAIYEKGKLIDVMGDAELIFTIENGRARSFEFRDIKENKVYWKGERINR